MDININLDYNCERENEELYKLCNKNYILEWSYNENGKCYHIENTYNNEYSKKTLIIGKHYKFNHTLHRLYRYDFVTLNISENFSLMDNINERFPVLKRFIDYNQVETVSFRIVNKISVGKYKNLTTELARDQVFWASNYQLIECIIILALIKAMNFDDPKSNFSLYLKDTKEIIQLFDKYKITLDKIFNLIDQGLCAGDLHNNKHSVLANVIISESPINRTQDMYEFKFISALHSIFNDHRPTNVTTFLKEGTGCIV